MCRSITYLWTLVTRGHASVLVLNSPLLLHSNILWRIKVYRWNVVMFDEDFVGKLSNLVFFYFPFNSALFLQSSPLSVFPFFLFLLVLFVVSSRLLYFVAHGGSPRSLSLSLSIILLLALNFLLRGLRFKIR